jgi:hypothetical protein
MIESVAKNAGHAHTPIFEPHRIEVVLRLVKDLRAGRDAR